jgi:hypothetical protein
MPPVWLPEGHRAIFGKAEFLRLGGGLDVKNCGLIIFRKTWKR